MSHDSSFHVFKPVCTVFGSADCSFNAGHVKAKEHIVIKIKSQDKIISQMKPSSQMNQLTDNDGSTLVAHVSK